MPIQHDNSTCLLHDVDNLLRYIQGFVVVEVAGTLSEQSAVHYRKWQLIDAHSSRTIWIAVPDLETFFFGVTDTGIVLEPALLLDLPRDFGLEIGVVLSDSSDGMTNNALQYPLFLSEISVVVEGQI